jgi:hypothetical protein
MIHIDTSKAIKEIKATLGNVTEKQNNTAISRALNRGINSGRTEGNKQVRNNYNLNARTVNERSKVSPAKLKKLYATLKVSLRPINVIYYKARQTKDGIVFEVLKGKKERIQSGFIAFVKGRIGAFARGEYKSGKFVFRNKRVKKKGVDAPIEGIKSTSIGAAFKNENVFGAMERRSMEIFISRYSHELKKILNI